MATSVLNYVKVRPGRGEQRGLPEGNPAKNSLKGWYRDMSSGWTCQRVMRARRPNTRRRRRRLPLSTTSLTIDALLPPWGRWATPVVGHLLNST